MTGWTSEQLQDPLALAQALIRCPSVTPADAGALDCLQAALECLGFRCQRLPFSAPDSDPIDNLYASIGIGHPHLLFAGHTDVVPVGDASAWTVAPFAADIFNDVLYGRGAADMKGAIAAFVAAVAQLLAKGPLQGRISLLITGDEEGPSVNGTCRMLPYLAAQGEKFDACITGEPTNPNQLGDMMKIGRRGSLNALIRVQGIQGHVGYPHLADNSAHRLVAILADLCQWQLDEGNDYFQPSSLQVTTIDIGNPTTNIIPGQASASVNIRFNDHYSGASLQQALEARIAAASGDAAKVSVTVKVSGESFLTPPGHLSDLLAEACKVVTGQSPVLSTSGGTSDSRFIKDYCPVVDFGLVGQSMHKADEHVAIADLRHLAQIYAFVAARFGAGPC